MAALLIILCVALFIIFPNAFWIILIVVGASAVLFFVIKAKKEREKAELKWRIKEEATKFNSDPTHNTYNNSISYKAHSYSSQSSCYPDNTTVSHVQKTSNPSVASTSPAQKTTNPTAQNAYIYNIDYINSCRSIFIAFDVETTGLSPASDRIIELSAVRYCNFSPCETFSTLINPRRHIPHSASAVNHIYDNDVTDAPEETDAIKNFCDFIGSDALQGNVTLVAHNALFDIKFLLYALSRSGINANIQFQDTLYMARNIGLGISDNKLQTIADHFGITQNITHRAFDDARTCGEVFIKLLSIKFDEHTEKHKYLSKEEMELCKWLKEVIEEAGLNTQLLTFYSKTYLQFKCLREVARFKTKAKKPYALIPKDIKIPDGIEAVIPSKSESKSYLRVYYKTPSDLAPLKPFYIKAYTKSLYDAVEYISESTDRMKAVATQINLDICI